MIGALHFGMAALAILCSGQLFAQTDASKVPPIAAEPPNLWEFNLSVSGYDVPHGQSYASPTFTADHDTLHLEAADNFFYRWTQLTYSLVPWFSAGYVVQRT